MLKNANKKKCYRNVQLFGCNKVVSSFVKNKIHTVLKQVEGKLYNFHFGVNYPFKNSVKSTYNLY